MPKASEITRILSATFTLGKKVISLTEAENKPTLQAMLILLGSAINHSDAKISGEDVSAFLADVDKSKLADYTVVFTDQVKEVSCTGLQLYQLAEAFKVGVITDWKVDRGGSREGSKKEIKTLGSM